MIRAARLAVSRPMYAFNRSTWRPSYSGFVVDAVWFRRKNGVTLAAMGTYHPMVMGYDRQPTDDTYESWIAAADDNRYGGNHLASWDGQALLCTDPPAVPPEVATERIAFLDTMLKGFPDPPAGYDGWYAFERARSSR